MGSLLGMLAGVIGWFVVRYGVFGFYTVEQNERAVKTVFGKAERMPVADGPAVDNGMTEEEHERYDYPVVRVIPPGGPYFKMPWEKIYKVSIATQTVSIGFDPSRPSANNGGEVLEAVTKDQLNTGLTGQLRYNVAESNLYAYLFGVKSPAAHVMGFFQSLLRDRIANFEAPPLAPGTEVDPEQTIVSGISINDLRKNLRNLNEHMEQECKPSGARYGIVLNAALMTGIDPPADVESALAAINTAHNHVSSDISLAQASADQTIVQSKRAVEIETLKAQSEVEPLNALAKQLADLKSKSPNTLQAYLQNLRLGLFRQSRSVILESPKSKEVSRG
jgi:regulator of protease activity HflC (stomatin/prohibitin superfamily)